MTEGRFALVWRGDCYAVTDETDRVIRRASRCLGVAISTLSRVVGEDERRAELGRSTLGAEWT